MREKNIDPEARHGRQEGAPSDAREFGPIADTLTGRGFDRVLATNSIKLLFGTHAGPKGTHYIWIDPPWEFHSPEGLVTTSRGYTDEGFDEWSRLFDPINEGVLTSWDETEDGTVRFRFESGHRLALPPSHRERREDDWYTHWYAWDRTAADA